MRGGIFLRYRNTLFAGNIMAFSMSMMSIGNNGKTSLKKIRLFLAICAVQRPRLRKL
jgi:hypothetical protein